MAEATDHDWIVFIQSHTTISSFWIGLLDPIFKVASPPPPQIHLHTSPPLMQPFLFAAKLSNIAYQLVFASQNYHVYICFLPHLAWILRLFTGTLFSSIIHCICARSCTLVCIEIKGVGICRLDLKSVGCAYQAQIIRSELGV